MSISVKLTKKELLRKCRICILNDGLCPMFPNGEDVLNVKTTYEACTGLKVNEKDNLPKSLCSICWNGLFAAHSFIENCKVADTALQNLETAISSEASMGYKFVVLADDSTIEFEYVGDVSCTEVDNVNSDSLRIQKAQNADSDNINADMHNAVNLNPKIIVQLLPTDDVVESSNNDTENHQKSLNKEKTVVMNTANQFNSLSELNTNVTGDHQQATDIKDKISPDFRHKKHTCLVCLSQLSRKHGLVMHMRTHTNEKPYQCNECSARFSLHGNLTRHLLIHTGEKPYKCNICGKAFNQSTALKLHNKKVHTLVSNKKIAAPLAVKNVLCSYCGMVCRNNVSLTKHILRKHSESCLSKGNIHKALLDNFCNICSRFYYTKNALKLHHERVHTRNYKVNQGIIKHLCNICGKQYSSKNGLNTHFLMHTGEKPYLCEYCDKRFTRNNLLQTHIMVHTGIRPHKCNTCDKSFKQLSHLKYHLLFHSGEKRHSCIECGKKFAIKGHLKEHYQSVHTDERPHHCKYCNKGFKLTRNLKTHLKIHKNERSSK